MSELANHPRVPTKARDQEESNRRSADSINYLLQYVSIIAGVSTGSPEGIVTAKVGSLYCRTDGGAGTTLYVKESGTGNTGWVAK